MFDVLIYLKMQKAFWLLGSGERLGLGGKYNWFNIKKP